MLQLALSRSVNTLLEVNSYLGPHVPAQTACGAVSTSLTLPHQIHSVNQMTCYKLFDIIIIIVGLGGLEVMFSPRDPRFAGSNPAEVDGFFRT